MMQELFSIYDSVCTKHHDQNQCLESLLSFYTQSPSLENNIDNFLYKLLNQNNEINSVRLLSLIGIMHQKRKESTQLYNTNERKHYGIYYTDYEIARLIAKEALVNLNFNQLINSKFLEPCSGTGAFVIAYIDEVLSKSKKYSKKDVQKIIDNIYCADIDKEAVRILKEVIKLHVHKKYHFDINLNNNNFYKGNILFKNKNGRIEKNDPKDIFNIKDGFDIVLTNPPYKLLKANGNKYKQNEQNDHAKEIVDIIRFIKKNNIYKYNHGTLNYYKIFVEEILENYTHKNSRIGLLIPQTLLNDSQSENLRKNIINNYGIEKIYIIPEKNEFFPDITQSFCFFAIDKSKNTNSIIVNDKVRNKNNFQEKGSNISIECLKNISNSLPIFNESEIGWNILKKITKHKKLGDLSDFKNLRGELDLTLNKKFITNKKTQFKLLKGVNIKEYKYENGDYYVEKGFLENINGKKKYISGERIVCQQISNLNSNKRIKFAKIPKNYILGNSCNFIVKDNSTLFDSGLNLDYLFALLNSFLIDWRFKLTSSNNHISNYELNDLPIIIPDNKKVNKILNTIKRINSGLGDYEKNVAILNLEIFKLYKLTKKEVEYILSKYKTSDIIKFIMKNYSL